MGVNWGATKVDVKFDAIVDAKKYANMDSK